MKKFLNLTVLAAALLVLFSGCRKESTERVAVGLYATECEAETYSEIWDVLWRGFDQNYVGWEIEDFDWDESKEIYTPKFEELDERVEELKKAETPDKEALEKVEEDAETLMHEIFDRFHDGHLFVEYVDYATEERHGFSPSDTRNSDREDIDDSPKLEKSYYCTSDGEFGGTGEFSYISVSNLMCKMILEKLPEMEAEYTRLSGLESLEPEEEELLKALESRLPSFRQIKSYMDKSEFYASSLYERYKDSLKEYEMTLLYLEFDLPKTHFEDDDIASLVIGTTRDNIIYYRVNHFYMPEFGMLELSEMDKLTDADHAIYDAYYAALRQLHDKAYKMHDEGTLKGIILDVRGNGGGLADHLKWVAGMFYKGERYALGTMKMKDGLGRLDYTLPFNFYMKCYGTNEEDIDEPIVILTNANSVSCSEVTTASVKQHPNGISMGMTTWGGGNKLVNDAAYDSVLGYAGCIGKHEETPVFVYMPYILTTYYDLGIIDGVGIAPDIEIRYDAELYKATGRDNQFERALSYIREGK